jgi:hypothetical protein
MTPMTTRAKTRAKIDFYRELYAEYGDEDYLAQADRLTAELGPRSGGRPSGSITGAYAASDAAAIEAMAGLRAAGEAITASGAYRRLVATGLGQLPNPEAAMRRVMRKWHARALSGVYSGRTKNHP